MNAQELLEQGIADGSLAVDENGAVHILDGAGNTLMVCHVDLLPDLYGLGVAA